MRYRKRHEFIQGISTPLFLKLGQMLKSLRGPKIALRKDDDPQPFFIIGSGRSGSTLLRTLLSQHRSVCIPPETHGALPNAVKQYYRLGNVSWTETYTAVLAEFFRHPRFKFWGLSFAQLSHQLEKTPVAERSVTHILETVFRQYAQQKGLTFQCWGDKTPFNTLRIKWLERLYPKARYIYLLRDPRAVVHSYLKAGLIPDAEEAIERWQASYRAMEKHQKKARFRNRFLVLRYEDLTQDPAHSLAECCRFLGLDFYPEMIDERRVDLGDSHVAHHRNVKGEVNTAYNQQWREAMDPQTVALIEKRLAAAMRQAHYL